jgi:hypothetical protein
MIWWAALVGVLVALELAEFTGFGFVGFQVGRIGFKIEEENDGSVGFQVEEGIGSQVGGRGADALASRSGKEPVWGRTSILDRF